MGTENLTYMLKLNTHLPCHCGKQMGNKTDNSENYCQGHICIRRLGITLKITVSAM